MSRTDIQEIDKMGRKLAKKCINESRRRVLAESDNWRDNHMAGTADNTKAFEEWARRAYMMGYSPEYVQSIGELNSWVGGGAESNGLIDWSSGWPVLNREAYAEFANGDNNIFKRNNAAERNAWANERLGIIGQEEQMRNAMGGMPPMGGGMPPYGMPPYGMPPMGPPPPPPAYGGGGDDDIFKYMMLNDYMRAQDVARNEAAAHPECASGTCRHSEHHGGAPTLNPMLPLLMMSGGSRRPSVPPMGGGRPPMGGYPGRPSQPRPMLPGYGLRPMPFGGRVY